MELLPNPISPDLTHELPSDPNSKSNYYHVIYRFTCPVAAFNQNMFQELVALTSKYDSTLKEFSVNQW